MNGRRLALGVGVLLFFVGVLAILGITYLSVSRNAIFLIGLVVILAALSGLSSRREKRRIADTTDPEHRATVSTPGHDLSRTINQFRTETYGFAADSQRIVEGLHGAALAVLTRFDGQSEAEALDRIENGTWTEDDRAAAFLSSDLEAPTRSVRNRLAAVFDSRTTFRQDVSRTAATIASIGYGGLGERPVATDIPQYDPEELDDVTPRTTTLSVSEVTERAARETGYWTGVGALSLLAVGIGAIAESPGVVLAGVVGVGYAGSAHLRVAPHPNISLERTLSNETPDPGEEVAVTVTITNESASFIPDLRLIDGVPAGLALTDGSARLGTSLRPEESVTLEYTVTARRGTHTFDPALVITRDLSRSSERECYVGTETTLVSQPLLRPLAATMPLRPAAAAFSGQLTTAEAGEGMQFHSVREYRRNDPLNRIDWNRHARSGELATLEFHEERAARVLILIDARKASYLAPKPDAPHAVDRAVEAAGLIAASLLDAGDTVGLAALGPVNRTDTRQINLRDTCWLAPSSGQHHRIQFSELLASHPQFATEPPRGKTQWQPQLRMIRRRLSAETQILFISPLCDATATRIVRRLDARGHALTVLSPDPTAERTTSQQLARVARRIRRFDLQRAGVPVIDWPADETIDEVIARANAGENR
ncbi:DUF58 domain-containing protein [Natrialbaceae archaeon A-CW1-1]